MEGAHKKGVVNEIEKSRVESYSSPDSYDFFTTTESTTKQRRTMTYGPTHSPQHARSRFKKRPGSEHSLVKSVVLGRSRTSSTIGSRDVEGKPDEVDEILNSGMLYKTSRGKITPGLTRGPHEHRQYRRFQLTEHSLEYSQLLQRVCA